MEEPEQKARSGWGCITHRSVSICCQIQKEKPVLGDHHNSFPSMHLGLGRMRKLFGKCEQRMPEMLPSSRVTINRLR